MAGERGRVVRLAQYRGVSAPAGGRAEYCGDPIPARGVRTAILTGWMDGQVCAVLEGARDKKSWAEVTKVESIVSQEAIAQSPVAMEWLRVKATLEDGARAAFVVDGVMEASEGSAAGPNGGESP